jgi:glutamate-1-semialdehyde 2,1-aminomutase
MVGRSTLVELGSAYRERVATAAPTSRTDRLRASQVLAGGVSGDAKAWAPLLFGGGGGCHITDIDGNDYVDLIMGFGASILGHGVPISRTAIEAALADGAPLGVSTPMEVALAEEIQRLVPSMEMMRFVATGSEATMMALRTARAFTQRSKIAKFEGHYHGQHDCVLISATGRAVKGSVSSPEPISDCAGLSSALVDEVVVMSWHDLASNLEQIQRHGHDLAAVILEPVPAQLGATPPDDEYLIALRDVTQELGILLIFDEVVTGFRLALGGAADFFGVRPDLHVFGKIAGGGLPLGAYGGRRDIMDAVVTPASRTAEQGIYQSGTFSGLPAAMAAGLATLTEIQNTQALAIASARGNQIRLGWKEICDERGLKAQVTGVESMFSIFFTQHTVRTSRDVLTANRAASQTFSMGLLAEGVYLPPQHQGLTSAAHTPDSIAAVLEASERVLAEMTDAMNHTP